MKCKLCESQGNILMSRRICDVCLSCDLQLVGVPRAYFENKFGIVEVI